MKQLVKLMVIGLGLVVLIFVALYALLQTGWAAKQLSLWVNNNTPYRVAFSHMEHSWSAPTHVVFNNVTLGNAQHSTAIIAKKLEVGLSRRQLSDPLDVDSILLRQGTLTLQDNISPFPLKASRLHLQDINIENNNLIWPLTIQHADAAITPFLPSTNNPLGNKANIDVSAETITLKGITASNVLLRGSVDNGNVILSTVNANIARGSLAGSNIRRNKDDAWTISKLRLKNLRLQVSQSLADFLTPLREVPAVKIDHLDIIGAKVEGHAWAVSDLDLRLRKSMLTNGDWHSEEGTLSMSARDFIWNAIHLQDPIINADLNRQGLLLRQFSSRWEGGMVRANGQWQRNTDSAVIDEIVFTGLEYTLPMDWKKIWMQPLPAGLVNVTIKKLSANRNLIIDINPDWPFQLTALDASASNLVIAHDHHWGLWDGKASFNAADATFNRVDVRRPSLTLDATPQQITLSEINAFKGKGRLEATANITQTPQRVTHVTLIGHSIPLNTLNAWGWPAFMPQDEGNLELSANGKLAAGAALQPTVNAVLKITDSQGLQSQQIMTQGIVSAP